MRKTRALRFPATLFALVMFVSVLASGDARAQFVCDPGPTPPSGPVVCTITGNFAGVFDKAQALGGGDAATINSKTGIVDGILTSSESGAATTTNFGSVSTFIDTSTSNGGNATTTNASSSDFVDINTHTDAGGNAATNNSGTALRISTSAIAVGIVGVQAVTNNSGFVLGSITTSVDFGDAITVNSGNILSLLPPFGAGIKTQTDLGSSVFSNGNATTINTATVVGGIDTITGYHVGGDGNATLMNSGVVIGDVNTVTGSSGSGGNGNATTINFGFMTGTVATVTGASSGSGDATTTNYGTINGDIYTSAADGSFGTGNAQLVNYGKVTSDSNGVSVLASSGNANFANFGSVDVSNVLMFPFVIPGHDTGIFVSTTDGDATAYNKGSILGGIGVTAGDFGTATITNAGLIDGTKSASGVAIDMTQFGFDTKSTLNILPGSRVLGSIILNDPFLYSPRPTTVNIFGGQSVSSVLTFGDVCGCGGIVETGAPVNVFGAPYIINGDTVAVLDPTSFAAQDRNVLDFTHTVLSAATSRLNNPAPMSGDGSAAIGFAPSGNVARDMANDAFASIPALSYAGQDRVLRSNPNFTAADGTSVWAQGFGGLRVQQADGPNLRSVNQFYGGILGLDKAVRPNLRLGGFIGAGSVSSDINMNSGSTKSDMAFGGVYGRYAIGRAFLDFALLGGGSNNDVKRTMTNNLVPGGYEFASASYNGWYISPELAYGVRQDIAKNWTATPTLRVRYLAANFGGYQESGSSNNLTVSGRTTHNFEERGEVVFTRTTNEREGSVLQINGTVGLLAWQRAGDTMINTVLLGQNLAFATTGKNNVVGGYAGGGFDWRQTSGVSVFGATEITAMSDSSHTITGRGGVKVAF